MCVREALTNDQSKLNDVSFLKRFCESKISNSTLTIPPIAIYEVYIALLQLKQTGTRGLDDLDGTIIKMSAHIITIIIIMYIYHALINALSAHMIHINLNMVFYTHVKHSPTKTIYIKYYLKINK